VGWCAPLSVRYHRYLKASPAVLLWTGRCRHSSYHEQPDGPTARTNARLDPLWAPGRGRWGPRGRRSLCRPTQGHTRKPKQESQRRRRHPRSRGLRSEARGVQVHMLSAAHFLGDNRTVLRRGSSMCARATTTRWKREPKGVCVQVRLAAVDAPPSAPLAADGEMYVMRVR